MLTAERLEEIRALLANATPGPWRMGQPRRDRECMHCRIGYDIASFNVWAEPGVDVTSPHAHIPEGNARLIAAAPSIVAELLAEAELVASVDVFEPLSAEQCVEFVRLLDQGLIRVSPALVAALRRMAAHGGG